MAKAPPGWQATQQGSAYLPNGELNPLVVAAQQAAMKLAQQVLPNSYHLLISLIHSLYKVRLICISDPEHVVQMVSLAG